MGLFSLVSRWLPKTRTRTRPHHRLMCEPLEDRFVLSTFFVATTGNNSNTGSLNSPFATIQHALDVARPGDDIEVRAGTFHEKITFTRSGNATAGYITLEAYNGESVILDGTGVKGDNMVLINNKSYVKLIGFEITNLKNVNDGSGVRVLGSGNHIEIRDNIIHAISGISAMGITVYGTGPAAIGSLIIDANEIYDVDASPSEALTLNGNVNNFTVTNNIVHDVNNIGIDLIGGETDIQSDPTLVARNGLVAGNTVYNCRSNYGGGYAAGIYVDGGRNITIENNISHDNDLGLEVGAENRGTNATGIIVRNNVIYNNDKAGLVLGGYDASVGRVKNCTFTNNTVYKNDTLDDGNGQLWIQYASNNIITNNIFWAAQNDVLLASDAGNSLNILDNNLWFADDGVNNAFFTWNGKEYDSFAAFQKGTGQDSHGLFANPKFKNAANHDFHLLSGSPAINAGTDTAGRFAPKDFDGVTRPRGAKPDIGAFEF